MYWKFKRNYIDVKNCKVFGIKYFKKNHCLIIVKDVKINKCSICNNYAKYWKWLFSKLLDFWILININTKKWSIFPSLFSVHNHQKGQWKKPSKSTKNDFYTNSVHLHNYSPARDIFNCVFWCDPDGFFQNLSIPFEGTPQMLLDCITSSVKKFRTLILFPIDPSSGCNWSTCATPPFAYH